MRFLCTILIVLSVLSARAAEDFSEYPIVGKTQRLTFQVDMVLDPHHILVTDRSAGRWLAIVRDPLQYPTWHVGQMITIECCVTEQGQVFYTVVPNEGRRSWTIPLLRFEPWRPVRI